MQTDGSWQINDQHTLRLASWSRSSRPRGNTFSQVLPVDSAGTPTSDHAAEDHRQLANTGGLYGVYVQDEWRIMPKVTVNGGVTVRRAWLSSPTGTRPARG